MHTNERIELSPASLTELPPTYSAIHTVDCPRCHYRQPVSAEYTDWKAVAEAYRDAYKAMGEAFLRKLKEAAEAFGVPLEEFFDVDRQILLAEIQEILDRLKKRP